ncbi:hypothetical protein [Tropicibacter sp. S64]|uniref:hypothetical protein n=1 Tax=Tropicibacter sp. S64 TaxID=3415122 RepID=UPI003C7A69C5
MQTSPIRLTGAAVFWSLVAPLALAQDLHNTDVVISGKITQNGSSTNYFNGSMSSFNGTMCVGSSCQTSESNGTGSPPLKLKYTTTDIIFEDTSTTPGIQSGDWRLKINDSGSGIDRFTIKDEDDNTTPFTVENAAPNDTLWIGSDGQIGFRTSIPEKDLHLKAAIDPTLRLEQTGTARKWDVVGGQNFTVQDRTLSGSLPFQIESNTPTSTLYLDNAGRVGIGYASPQAKLHVRAPGSKIIVEDSSAAPAVREMFLMQNNGGSYFTLDNTASGTTWYFTHEQNSPNRFIITDGVADGPEMTLTAEGDLTIQGQLFTAGSCSAGCDRVFDADYPLPSIAEQAAMMREMKHLPNVGPTPEDGPFNLTAMTGGMLNELEKAHLYIAELHGENAALEARVTAQDARLAELEALVRSLAAR